MTFDGTLLLRILTFSVKKKIQPKFSRRLLLYSYLPNTRIETGREFNLHRHHSFDLQISELSSLPHAKLTQLGNERSFIG